MNYYISDLHLGHANVIRFDNRPYSNVIEMYNDILDKWNKKVKTTDTVYILGDFCWAKENLWYTYIAPFAGNKVLIRGNHDPQQLSAKTKSLFQDIKDYKEINDDGRKVVLCHYPIPCFRSDMCDMSYMLYGHVHMTSEYDYILGLRREIINTPKEKKPNANFINVGCMLPYMSYTPRTLDEIIEGDAVTTRYKL